MKNSNKLLCSLGIIILASIALNDVALKKVYASINLNDTFKNYQHISIQPFKFLKMQGGNGYAIEINQSAKTDMMVMSSRKTFLNTSYNNDTLFITFTVASNQQIQYPTDLPIGLIITSPAINNIYVNGTSNLITSWQGDDLKLTQTGNAITTISNLNTGKLSASAYDGSIINFQSANKVDILNLQLQNNAAVLINNVEYKSFNPVLVNDAKLVYSAASAGMLRK